MHIQKINQNLSETIDFSIIHIMVNFDAKDLYQHPLNGKHLGTGQPVYYKPVEIFSMLFYQIGGKASKDECVLIIIIRVLESINYY